MKSQVRSTKCPSKVADFYEEDVDNAVDNLSSLLEPLIMSILGVLVGGLVVAMYLPIFKMGQRLSRTRRFAPVCIATAFGGNSGRRF